MPRPGRLPRAARRAPRGRRGPPGPRDVPGPRPAPPGDLRGPRCHGPPIVASMTFGEELGLADGRTPEDAAALSRRSRRRRARRQLRRGPQRFPRRARPDRPAAPRAARLLHAERGAPQADRGAVRLRGEPAWFGEVVPVAIAAGARIVGGCCGTTPAHVAAMRAAVDTWIATHDAGAGDSGTPRPSVRRGARSRRRSPIAGRRSSRCASYTTAGNRFRRCRRTDPDGAAPEAPRRPVRDLRGDRSARSIRIERTVEAARLLATAGTDCVNISDSAMARVRMGALAVRSESSTTWTSSAWSTSPPVTGT